MADETNKPAEPARPAAAAAAAAEPAPRALRGAVGSQWHNTMTIAGREFRAYFNTPMGYILIAIFTLLLGVLFFYPFLFLVLRKASLTQLFSAMSWLFPMLCAAISMRTFADETRSGTLELLITMPVRDAEVVVGKFLGALGLLAVTLLATFVYPLAVSRMGDLDWGPVWGGYLGLLLGGGAYIAIGMVVSSYARDQIVAFLVAFVINAILFIMNKALIAVGGGQVGSVIEYICFDTHFTSIARGVIDSRDVIYFLSVIGACLLATARSLASRRWS